MTYVFLNFDWKAGKSIAKNLEIGNASRKL